MKYIKDVKKNCPVCSQSVTLSGDATMYYVPSERENTIKELLELPLEDQIFLQDELSKNKKDFVRAKDIADSLRGMIRRHFNVPT